MMHQRARARGVWDRGGGRRFAATVVLKPWPERLALSRAKNTGTPKDVSPHLKENFPHGVDAQWLALPLEQLLHVTTACLLT